MRRPHLRYADVTATLALIVALGGTSYAAVKLTGADIKDGSLTSADIKNRTLRTRDIAPDTTVANADAVGGAELKTGLVTLAEGDAEPLGTVGPFTFEARCIPRGSGEGGSDVQAGLRLLVGSSESGSIAASAWGSTDPLGPGVSHVLPLGGGFTEATSDNLDPRTQTSSLRADPFYALTPGGYIASGTIASGRSALGSDCVFAITATGASKAT